VLRRGSFPRRTIDTLVEGIPTALDGLVKELAVNKTLIFLCATGHGYYQLKELPEWTPLEDAFHKLDKRARGKDRSAIRVLEARQSFQFPRRFARKTTLSFHPWAIAELTQAAAIAGLPDSTLIVAALLLSFRSIPEWVEFFNKERTL